MAKHGEMSQDDFYRLLQWFGPDRDASAKKYLEAHGNLTRYFRFNYCECPEDLADEVMNRAWRASFHRCGRDDLIPTSC
jgi:hypothetical protein